MYRNLRSRADATAEDRVCTRSLESDKLTKTFIPTGKLTPFRVRVPQN
jgi:hypothetical protein